MPKKSQIELAIERLEGQATAKRAEADAIDLAIAAMRTEAARHTARKVRPVLAVAEGGQ